MDESILLEQLNKFTRRQHTAEEVYIFSAALCDNEIDRDNERFSREALEEMAEKFVGVTGIFNHDPKGENQTARLFMTEVEENGEVNSLGEKYALLKGWAYMVRTPSNADLIREIEGGIKKEVSVSCAAEKHICSVCGNDRRKKPCRHVKGNIYDGKKCFVTLSDISDAYEWSFVAVPAQVRAGVTKKYDGGTDRALLEERILGTLSEKDAAAEKLFLRIKDKLDGSELKALAETVLQASCRSRGNASRESCEEYMMRA